jgi:hypothetical protein
MAISGNARSILLVGSPVRGSTLVGSNLACKYNSKVEVKHSRLLRCGNIYHHKEIYSTGPCCQYSKTLIRH